MSEPFKPSLEESFTNFPESDEEYSLLLGALTDFPAQITDYSDPRGDGSHWLPRIHGAMRAMAYAEARDIPELPPLDALYTNLSGYRVDQMLFARKAGNAQLAQRAVETADQMHTLAADNRQYLANKPTQSLVIESVVLAERLKAGNQHPIVFATSMITKLRSRGFADDETLDTLSHKLMQEGKYLVNDSKRTGDKNAAKQGVMLLQGVQYLGLSAYDSRPYPSNPKKSAEDHLKQFIFVGEAILQG